MDASAATVVLLRDGDAGVEVLLGERPGDRGSFAGAWVFPGGAVDDADAAGDAIDSEAAARRAAVRETLEEVGLRVDEAALVGFSVSRQAALHELLRGAGGCAISLLAAGQDWLAEHFARGVPPIGMWHGVATEPGAKGAPLLVGALGWLECAVRDEVAVGTHTLFVCEVERVEQGVDAPALVSVRGRFAIA